MSVTNFKRKLLQAVLEHLWHQWSALGIMGYATLRHDKWAIDPEALLICSAGFCRYDQRLYDLMLSWLMKYGTLLSPTRVKALLRVMPAVDNASLVYVAAQCAQSGDKRWQNLIPAHGEHPESAKALFRNPDDTPVLPAHSEDALARKHGFIRNAFMYQDKSKQVLPDNKATLLLRMRSLFGVSARADIITHLAMNACTISELVDQSGYARSSIKEVLVELEAGNSVETVGQQARNVAYVLTCADSLRRMMNMPGSSPVHWRHVYSALMLLWQHLIALCRIPLSEATINGELALLYKDSLQQHMWRSGIDSLQNMKPNALPDLPATLTTL